MRVSREADLINDLLITISHYEDARLQAEKGEADVKAELELAQAKVAKKEQQLARMKTRQAQVGQQLEQSKVELRKWQDGELRFIQEVIDIESEPIQVTVGVSTREPALERNRPLLPGSSAMASLIQVKVSPFERSAL